CGCENLRRDRKNRWRQPVLEGKRIGSFQASHHILGGTAGEEREGEDRCVEGGPRSIPYQRSRNLPLLSWWLRENQTYQQRYRKGVVGRSDDQELETREQAREDR